MKIHRNGFGMIARLGCLVIAVVVTLLAAREFDFHFGSVMLTGSISLGAVGAVLLVLVAVVVGTYLTLLRPKSSDFLVEVESEMKKVSWSSMKELRNGTIVVIALCVVFGLYVFIVDYGLAFLLDKINRL